MKDQFRESVILKDYCTYGVGGPAEFFFEPRDFEALESAIKWAHKNSTPYFIMGAGSNILVSDKGYKGLILCMVNTLCQLEIEGLRVRADCGAGLSRLIEQCCQKGLSGMEKLYDIPGTIGGAVYMNAGAFGSEIGDVVETVMSMDAAGQKRERRREEIQFGYRNSTFQAHGETILSVTFLLKEDSSGRLLKEIEEIKEKRRSRQPYDKACCGSVFKRPNQGFAGALIESAGLKGMRMGGARVSEKHANFIINEGNATAGDIKALVDHIQKEVKRKSNICLEPEVVFLGEFA
jgi:UDP-N-acetylmuramate dehydrogenase